LVVECLDRGRRGKLHAQHQACASAVGPAPDGRANGSGDRDRKTEDRCRDEPLPGAFRAVDAGRGGAARQRPNRVRELLSELAREYPHNPLYRQQLARLSPANRREQHRAVSPGFRAQTRSPPGNCCLMHGRNCAIVQNGTTCANRGARGCKPFRMIRSALGELKTFKVIQGFAKRHEWGRVGASTHWNIQLLGLVSQPLTPSRIRYIIPSGTKALLSLGLFGCGIQVRCSAAVNHPPDDSKSVRPDAARP
jgi:hypothetical protein